MEVEKMSYPKDWKEVKLGDVVDKVSVKALPKDYPDYPFIGMDCIEAHSLKPAFTYKFSEFKSAGNLFKKGQVLYGRMRPYLNKVYKADYEGTCSGEFIILQCKDNFTPDLLQYILHAKGFVSFTTHQTAGDRPRISFDEIAEYPISLPPLPEQQRIVAKIEELFSELDAGKQELQKAAQQLKVYRQAVLKWAFEGRLTNEVVDGELPDGWERVQFGSLFSTSPQNGVYKPASQYGTGTQIIRIDGFYDGCILDDYEYKRVKLSSNEIQNYSVSMGDILINRVNSMPYLGKCGLVKNQKEDLVFESNIMKVKVKEDFILPEYITMYLSSRKGLSELRRNAKQAVNQASINQTDVANVSVPLPPLEDQHYIVQEIESRLSVCDKIEGMIAESLQQAEALRQSILKKAFEGTLV